MREQRDRDAKRQLSRESTAKHPAGGALPAAKRELSREPTAKDPAGGDLPEAVLANVALPATRGSSSEHSNDLDDSALVDAERALVGTNGGSADGRGVVGQCGGSAASPAIVNGSKAAATPSTASTIHLTDEGGASSNGEAASEGMSEGEGRSNTTGPTTVRIPKVNIRWLPAEASPATGSSRPNYKRQLVIDETAEKARPAMRLPPLKRKHAADANDGASSQKKRARGRPHHD